MNKSLNSIQLTTAFASTTTYAQIHSALASQQNSTSISSTAHEYSQTYVEVDYHVENTTLYSEAHEVSANSTNIDWRLGAVDDKLSALTVS